MTDLAKPARPVPRWLHAWAVLTVAVTLVLLVLGQLVTSFGAGMADPIWPTEPWYLFVIGWQEPNRGYLIEHAHRIAGWTVGGVVGVLALGVWVTDQRKAARRIGLVGLVALLGAFGQFHGALIAQRDAVEITIPTGPVATMAAALGVVLLIAGAGVVRGVRGSGLRLLAVGALVAVMIQGLLGGFRVRLNALAGTDLAAVHGVFAQVVFCLLVSIAVLSGRPATAALPPAVRRPLGRPSLVLVGLLFVQLVWGAMVRHIPNSLNQRLHFLTAFLAVGAAVWLLRAGFSAPAARPRVARAGWVLGLLLAVQVTLGVEAWMGKFGEEARRGRLSSAFLPEAEKVTEKQAAIRSAHVLVGTGVLAAAVALALRVWTRDRSESESGSGWTRGGVEPESRVGVAPARVLTPTLTGLVQPGETP
ncbi:MAG: ctaA [Gemmataceae bacterium]|nr:ctaA [Gemmataceae bacterium]